ncbi:MAG: hypothetical protein ACJAS1_002860 [Oleiphilaceae bacterium]|jgi:hypothetical protein
MCDSNEALTPVSNKDENKKRLRKKLWQLHGHFHCSIIGTCLTLEELRFIASKHLPASMHVSDHELHRRFVCLAQNANGSTRHCQKRLDKKYQATIRLSGQYKTDAGLLSLWQTALTSGDIAGTYWAIVTHPNAGKDLLERVFGEVHMLSHLSGASMRTDIKLLGKLRHEKIQAETTLSQTNENFNTRLARKQNEIDHLKKIKTQLEQDILNINTLTTRIEELEATQNNQPLHKTIEGLSERLYFTTSQLGKAKIENQSLEIKFKNEQKRTTFLEQEAAQSLKERDMSEVVLQKLLNNSCRIDCGAPNKHSCPINNLDGKHILYVGGRVRQCPHFKALVEQSNGIFTHHDGGKEDSRLKLNGALAQADAVVCPTDHISHDAYNRIKQHCEKQNKQLVMIAHASLSSFTGGLNQVFATDLHTL